MARLKKAVIQFRQLAVVLHTVLHSASHEIFKNIFLKNKHFNHMFSYIFEIYNHSLSGCTTTLLTHCILPPIGHEKFACVPTFLQNLFTHHLILYSTPNPTSLTTGRYQIARKSCTFLSRDTSPSLIFSYHFFAQLRFTLRSSISKLLR